MQTNFFLKNCCAGDNIYQNPVKKTIFKSSVILTLLLIILHSTNAQTFVHPGGLHTLSDLDRMKAKVAAGEHPWIDGWNKLITDSQAQNTYTAAARANMGGSRQRADADAHAAYLNAIRWYISGDTTYAECAVRICNAWSSTVNQVPTGTDIPGLSGIPVFDFAMAAEVLRIYKGWSSADFDRFKNMMLTYFYPVCNDFLMNHNGGCISRYWSNWDICNTGAILSMGVLCDDPAKFNQAIDYFKTGAGMGSIINAVYTVHPGGLGQWQESGRDQEHAQLAVGMMASFCEVAWNQGVDLYGYDNNRLLAGAEYVARTNLSLPVPYTPYNNCDNANQLFLSINGLGRLDDRPVYEMIYNHYVVRKGLNAPNVSAMAGLMRPEHGSADHFGYGTLTFTRTASVYPPFPVPPVPNGLIVQAGVSNVSLNWNPIAGATAQGYKVLRATVSGGPYTEIYSSKENTYPGYTDWSVNNGITYYYAIAAQNQAGVSANSAEVSATPIAASAILPSGWARKDIGSVSVAGSASYGTAGNNTFIVKGSGSGIGGTADGFSYVYGSVSGDFTLTARVLAIGGTLSKTGIMFRETLDPNAKALVMKMGDAGWRQAGLGTRAATGGNMTWIGGNDYTWTPAWFRLQRSGNTFTAYQSADGVAWVAIGSTTVAMSNTYFVGLAACSGSTSGAINTTTFDNVLIVNNGTAPATPTGVKAKGAGSRNINLSWHPVEGATGYIVKRSVNAGGAYTVIATAITDSVYADSSLSANTSYYYVISSANLAGESANSSEANAATFDLIFPPVPTGLKTFSGDANVTLNWNISKDAATYSIKRSTTAGGPFVSVGTTTSTSYSDLSVLNNSTYFYVVSAVNIKGESGNSIQVGAIPRACQLDFWNFNEINGTIANDIWGGNKGVLQAGAGLVAGKNDNAVKLTGAANSYVALPAGIVSTLNDFSIATWVKMDVLSTWMRLFDFGTGTTQYMFLTVQSAVTSGKSKVRYAIKNGGTELNVGFDYTFPLGTWVHLAVTQSGNTGNLYINGALVATNTAINIKPSNLGNTNQNYLGKSQFADPMFQGSIDDFRIYKCALSTTEIAALAANVPATQSITFNPLTTRVVGEDDFDAFASASSLLPVKYSSSDSAIARIKNDRIQIIKAGTTNITASQEGNASYSAANSVVQTLTVTRKEQTITFNAIPAKILDDQDFDTGATASSGLPVSYHISNPLVATIVNGKIHLTGIGSCLITALQAGNEMYNAAGSVSRTLTVNSTLKIKYQDADANVTNNQIKPNLIILNEGATSVSYSDLTVRYWFTAENYAGINSWIDYAQLGNNKVNIKYVALEEPRDGAFGYIEYSFAATAGNLDAGTDSGQIQSRFANTNWSDLNENDDYSHSKSNVYAYNEHITMYRNGQLVWGVEPATVNPQIALKAYTETKSNNPVSNTISTYLKINNEGNVPVSYGEVKVRYWFTKEGTSNLNYYLDYAAMINSSNIESQFVALNPTKTGANTYLELGLKTNAGTFYPLSTTGNIQYRIAKADWSDFNQADDYSYNGNNQMILNDKVTVYYQGQLISGTEPVLNTNSRISADEPLTMLQAKIYGNPVAGDKGNVEITGIQGLPLTINLVNQNGLPLLEHQINQPKETERFVFPFGQQTPGVYFLRISTALQALTVKIIK